MTNLEQLRGYTVYQDPDVAKALDDTIAGKGEKVIWLFFNGNSFQARVIDNYLSTKVDEIVWKKLYEQQ